MIYDGHGATTLSVQCHDIVSLMNSSMEANGRIGTCKGMDLFINKLTRFQGAALSSKTLRSMPLDQLMAFNAALAEPISIELAEDSLRGKWRLEANSLKPGPQPNR